MLVPTVGHQKDEGLQDAVEKIFWMQSIHSDAAHRRSID